MDSFKHFKKFITIQKKYDMLQEVDNNLTHRLKSTELTKEKVEMLFSKDEKFLKINRSLKDNYNFQNQLILIFTFISLFALITEKTSFFIFSTIIFILFINFLLVQRFLLESKKDKEIDKFIKNSKEKSESKLLLKETIELRKELEKHSSLKKIYTHLKSLDDYEKKWFVLLYKTTINKEAKNKKQILIQDSKFKNQDYIDDDRLKENKLERDLLIIREHYLKSRIYND